MENHLDINSQFIPYNLALKLKELGIEFYPLGYYSLLEDNKIIESKFYASDDFLEAPLWQQAFDWFRFEHGHYCNIVPNPTSYIKHKNKEWLFGYNIINGVNPMFDLRYKTYEEARFKCLEKLIELVETKKDSV